MNHILTTMRDWSLIAPKDLSTGLGIESPNYSNTSSFCSF